MDRFGIVKSLWVIVVVFVYNHLPFDADTSETAVPEEQDLPGEASSRLPVRVSPIRGFPKRDDSSNLFHPFRPPNKSPGILHQLRRMRKEGPPSTAARHKDQQYTKHHDL
jgi:hypothetical protein